MCFSQILPYKYGKNGPDPGLATNPNPFASSFSFVRLRHAATSSALTWAASEAWELIGSPHPLHQDMQRGDARPAKEVTMLLARLAGKKAGAM